MFIFDNVFDELNNFFYGQGGYKSFPVDMVELPNGFQIIAEMPGVEYPYELWGWYSYHRGR